MAQIARRLATCLFCLTLMQPALAQSALAQVKKPNHILFMGVDSDTTDYQSQLLAHPEWRSPTQTYMQKSTSQEQREALMNDFLAAQRAFLQPDTSHAEDKWLQVLKQAVAADWEPDSQSIFIYSALRLAQMQLDPSQRDKRLAHVFHFGKGAGHESLPIDKTLFPPPILERLSQLRAETEFITPEVLALKKGWDMTLINGQPCTVRKCGQWPRNIKVRVTFLSDRWQAQSEILDIEELNQHLPKTEAYFTGHCDNLRWDEVTQDVSGRLAYTNAVCTSYKTPEKNIDLQSLKPKIESVERKDTLPIARTQAPSRPFYKSKWFWIGTGVLTAIVVASQLKKQSSNESVQPTTTYGIRF